MNMGISAFGVRKPVVTAMVVVVFVVVKATTPPFSVAPRVVVAVASGGGTKEVIQPVLSGTPMKGEAYCIEKAATFLPPTTKRPNEPSMKA